MGGKSRFRLKLNNVNFRVGRKVSFSAVLRYNYLATPALLLLIENCFYSTGQQQIIIVIGGHIHFFSCCIFSP